MDRRLEYNDEEWEARGSVPWMSVPERGDEDDYVRDCNCGSKEPWTICPIESSFCG